MSEKLGKARRLLKDTGSAITEQNHVLFTLEEWKAVDQAVADLEIDLKATIDLSEAKNEELNRLTTEKKELQDLQNEIEPYAVRLEPDVVMNKSAPSLPSLAKWVERFLTIMRMEENK